MEAPTLAIIETKSLEAIQKTLYALMNKVENIASKVDGITPPEDSNIPPAPLSFQVSLKDLASILGVSKSTLKRWICEGKEINGVVLSQPRKREHNRYCYYKKSDLPKSLYYDIDRFYYDKTNSSK